MGCTSISYDWVNTKLLFPSADFLFLGWFNGVFLLWWNVNIIPWSSTDSSFLTRALVQNANTCSTSLHWKINAILIWRHSASFVTSLRSLPCQLSSNDICWWHVLAVTHLPLELVCWVILTATLCFATCFVTKACAFFHYLGIAGVFCFMCASQRLCWRFLVSKHLVGIFVCTTCKWTPSFIQFTFTISGDCKVGTFRSSVARPRIVHPFCMRGRDSRTCSLVKSTCIGLYLKVCKLNASWSCSALVYATLEWRFLSFLYLITWRYPFTASVFKTIAISIFDCILRILAISWALLEASVRAVNFVGELFDQISRVCARFFLLKLETIRPVVSTLLFILDHYDFIHL